MRQTTEVTRRTQREETFIEGRARVPGSGTFD
jgi:hypothetical protein